MIHVLLREKRSFQHIAKVLGRLVSTISREVKVEMSMISLMLIKEECRILQIFIENL